MTSANRMMIVEMSKNIIKLWHIICDLFFIGRPPSKFQNVVFTNDTVILCPQSFAQKFHLNNNHKVRQVC